MVAPGSWWRWNGSSPKQPEVPLPPGATYGSFGAACHYKDGTFVFARVQELCAKRSPLYNGTNPYIQPFNHG